MRIFEHARYTISIMFWMFRNPYALRIIGLISLFVAYSRSATLSRVLLHKVSGFICRGVPSVNPDCVQRLRGPFDHVKRIDTAFAVWSELVDAVRDPAGAVAGNSLD